jgi:surfeit locus 1 family protein
MGHSILQFPNVIADTSVKIWINLILAEQYPGFCILMKYQRVPLIAFLCLLPVLLALGVWQLNRAEEKRALLQLQAQRQNTGMQTLSADTPDSSENLLYQAIQATGQYDSKHQYLLDNQVNKGRAGYFVLTPFRLKAANKAVLVNRGWIPLGYSRMELPDVRVDDNEITIAGRIDRFPRVGFKLAGAEIPADDWPAVVQVIDIDVLKKQLAYPLFSFQVELDKQSANGFVREWQVPATMTPEKHLAYAVQWFLLAITLTVLFVKYGINKKHD